MTGFKRERRTIRLVFDDPDLNGLVVLTRSVPLGVFMDMMKMAQLAEKAMTPADMLVVNDLFVGFAEQALVEWNLLDDNDQPVPPTLAGMQTQDTAFMLEIVMTWLGALGAAPGPLAHASSNGSTSDSQNSGLLS